jgi:tripartite ATP-independent transporter DctP family solute receptor
MKKSIVWIVLSLFCIVALFAGCGQSKQGDSKAAGAKVKMKLGTQLPDSHPISKAAVLFAKKVKEKSKGEIDITVFNNGTLGQERDLLEGMKLGTIDMANVNGALMTSFAPRWQVFSLPYIFQSEEHMYKVVNGPIGQDLFKDLEKSGIKGLSYQWSGFRSITSKKGPVNTPEDLTGQKIRSMPAKIMVDSINAMGGIATPMDQGAVYNSLQSGVLDGWENNPATVLSFKMNEVCPYFSYTNHFATPNVLVMSQKVWDKLSPEQQKLIMEVAAEAQKDESTLFHQDEKETVEKLKAQGMKFNEVDTKPFYEKVKPIWKSIEDVVGKQMLDDIDKLRSK